MFPDITKIAGKKMLMSAELVCHATYIYIRTFKVMFNCAKFYNWGM